MSSVTVAAEFFVCLVLSTDAAVVSVWLFSFTHHAYPIIFT